MIFRQDECGIFKLQDTAHGVIGTGSVGPCIVLFLYNPTQKICLAFHISDGISLQAIKKEISKYLSADNPAMQQQAFLVGGWRGMKSLRQEYDEKLIGWLQELGVISIDNSHVDKKTGGPDDAGPENYYHAVAFNLNNGELILEHKLENDMIPVENREDTEVALQKDCLKYLSNYGGAYHLSVSIKEMMTFREFAYENLAPNIKAFYQSIVDDNDATPVAPRYAVRDTVKQQLNKLAGNAQRTDPLEVLRSLYVGIANPVTVIPGNEGQWTPLHYACAILKKDPNNYLKQVCVLLILVQGRRDLPNKDKKCALDMLDQSAKFTQQCKALLNAFPDDKVIADNTRIRHQIAGLTRMQMALLADEVIEYNTYTHPAVRNEIHERLFGFIGWLNMNITAAKQQPDLRSSTKPGRKP